MNRKINWWVIVTLVFLAALALTFTSSLLRWGLGRDGSLSGWERWRGGMDTGGWAWQLSVLPFRCLMPALFITLVVMGIMWLVQAASASPGQGAGRPMLVPACAKCGRPVQAEWQICPYCGQNLKGKEEVRS